jgi:hypothetical protein
MIIKFDKPKNSGSGGNTGSSAQFVHYVDKEQKAGLNDEKWIDQEGKELYNTQVTKAIDSDRQGLRKTDGKFCTGSINPSAEEWAMMGKTEAEREANFKKWASKEFTAELASNFNKKDSKGNSIPIEPENVKIYFKMEQNRHFKGTDEEVKQGLAKSGEAKEGQNTHIHFIIARKTADGDNRIAPTTKNKKEFNQVDFFEKVEHNLDENFHIDREIKNTFEYQNTMKNGTAAEKLQAIERGTEKGYKQKKYKGLKLEMDSQMKAQLYRLKIEQQMKWAQVKRQIDQGGKVTPVSVENAEVYNLAEKYIEQKKEQSKHQEREQNQKKQQEQKKQLEKEQKKKKEQKKNKGFSL